LNVNSSGLDMNNVQLILHIGMGAWTCAAKLKIELK
jgi:hypothetical protein